MDRQAQVYQMPSGRTFKLRPRGEEEDPRPSKTQKRDDQQEEEDLGIDHLMEALEEAESDTIHLASTDCSMPLITCDEPLDVSFMGTEFAQDL